MSNNQVPVMTTSHEPFHLSDSKLLAIQVLRRFGSDIQAATKAWRRLLQNNCSEADFKALVDDCVSPETTYFAKVRIRHGEYEETGKSLVKAQTEQDAGRQAIERYSRDKIEWQNGLCGLDCDGEVWLELESLQPVSVEHAMILSMYL